eukprot:614573-Hanusia_phi.AAC.1
MKQQDWYRSVRKWDNLREEEYKLIWGSEYSLRKDGEQSHLDFKRALALSDPNVLCYSSLHDISHQGSGSPAACPTQPSPNSSSISIPRTLPFVSVSSSKRMCE